MKKDEEERPIPMTRIVEKSIIPIILGLVTWRGSCVATSVTDKFNRANILRDFAPMLTGGNSGQVMIAKMALNEYLTDDEKKDLDFALIGNMFYRLGQFVREQDISKTKDLLSGFKVMYPESYRRMATGMRFSKEDNPNRKILDETLDSDPRFREFWHKSLDDQSIVPKH